MIDSEQKLHLTASLAVDSCNKVVYWAFESCKRLVYQAFADSYSSVNIRYDSTYSTTAQTPLFCSGAELSSQVNTTCSVTIPLRLSMASKHCRNGDD